MKFFQNQKLFWFSRLKFVNLEKNELLLSSEDDVNSKNSSDYFPKSQPKENMSKPLISAVVLCIESLQSLLYAIFWQVTLSHASASLNTSYYIYATWYLLSTHHHHASVDLFRRVLLLLKDSFGTKNMLLVCLEHLARGNVYIIFLWLCQSSLTYAPYYQRHIKKDNDKWMKKSQVIPRKGNLDSRVFPLTSSSGIRSTFSLFKFSSFFHLFKSFFVFFLDLP